MANQLHQKPQRRLQDQPSKNSAQETTKTGHRRDPNTDVHRKRLCAVVLVDSAATIIRAVGFSLRELDNGS